MKKRKDKKKEKKKGNKISAPELSAAVLGKTLFLLKGGRSCKFSLCDCEGKG